MRVNGLDLSGAHLAVAGPSSRTVDASLSPDTRSSSVADYEDHQMPPSNAPVPKSDSFMISPLPEFTNTLPSSFSELHALPEVSRDEQDRKQSLYVPCTSPNHPVSCPCVVNHLAHPEASKSAKTLKANLRGKLDDLEITSKKLEAELGR